MSCCADFGRIHLQRGRSWGRRFALRGTVAQFPNVFQRGMIIECNDWWASSRVVPLMMIGWILVQGPAGLVDVIKSAIIFMNECRPVPV